MFRIWGFDGLGSSGFALLRFGPLLLDQGGQVIIGKVLHLIYRVAILFAGVFLASNPLLHLPASLSSEGVIL